MTEDNIKTLVRVRVITISLLLVVFTGVMPSLALAECVFSGTLSWGGNCGATVDETVAEGGYKSVNNTNLGYQGATTYFCTGGSFVKVGTDTCVAAAAAACSSPYQFTWNALDANFVSRQCQAAFLDPSWANGQHRVVTNTLSGVTGSATYQCVNGQAVLQGTGNCELSSGGGSTPPPSPPPGPVSPCASSTCPSNYCTTETCVDACGTTVLGSKNCSGSGGGGGGTPAPCSNACATATCIGSVCMNSCGVPVAGVKVCSGGDSSCVPNNACASNWCTFEYCPDGCGGLIQGTKSCDGQLCVPNNSCILTTPVGSYCTNNCGQQVPGSMRSGGSTPATPSLPPSSSAPPTATNISTTPPAVFTTPFTFGNPVAFSTVDGLFSRILSFLQATIVLLSLIFIIIGAFLYITSAGDEGRMTQGKKAILAALIGLALGIAAPAFLREIASILGWGTPNLPSGVGTSLTLIQIATNVLNFLLTIIGILAIIMLVIGGIMYLTAAGNEDTLDKGKKIVKYSLIGITIALASLVLVKAVAGLLS